MPSFKAALGHRAYYYYTHAPVRQAPPHGSTTHRRPGVRELFEGETRSSNPAPYSGEFSNHQFRGGADRPVRVGRPPYSCFVAPAPLNNRFGASRPLPHVSARSLD